MRFLSISSRFFSVAVSNFINGINYCIIVLTELKWSCQTHYHRLNPVKSGKNYSLRCLKPTIRRFFHFVSGWHRTYPSLYDHVGVLLVIVSPTLPIKKRCISLMYQPMGARRQIGIPWNLPQNVNLKKSYNLPEWPVNI